MKQAFKLVALKHVAIGIPIECRLYPLQYQCHRLSKFGSSDRSIADDLAGSSLHGRHNELIGRSGQWRWRWVARVRGGGGPQVDVTWQVQDPNQLAALVAQAITARHLVAAAATEGGDAASDGAVAAAETARLHAQAARATEAAADGTAAAAAAPAEAAEAAGAVPAAEAAGTAPADKAADAAPAAESAAAVERDTAEETPASAAPAPQTAVAAAQEAAAVAGAGDPA